MALSDYSPEVRSRAFTELFVSGGGAASPEIERIRFPGAYGGPDFLTPQDLRLRDVVLAALERRAAELAAGRDQAALLPEPDTERDANVAWITVQRRREARRKRLRIVEAGIESHLAEGGRTPTPDERAHLIETFVERPLADAARELPELDPEEVRAELRRIQR